MVPGGARWCQVVIDYFQLNKRINVFSFEFLLWKKDGNSKIEMTNILFVIIYFVKSLH